MDAAHDPEQEDIITTIRDVKRENHIAIVLLPALIATTMYLAAGKSAHAADCDFINTTPTTFVYFTNSANWNPGVPGPTDNAKFTNNITQYIDFGDATVITNANVYVNMTTSLSPQLRLYIRNATYWVTNSFIVGQNASSTSYVWHRSGTLAVTNAAGTASLIVGQAGQGQFDLVNGTLIVDHLYMTNNGAIANGFRLGVTDNNGSLTVRGDSTITGLDGGGYGGAYTSRWNVIGGTFTVQNDQYVGQRCMMILTASGTNTVMNFQGSLRIGHRPENSATNGNSVIVTNGTVVNVSGSTYVGSEYAGPANSADHNLVVVTGSNSLLNAGNLMIGSGGSNNQVRVANGGRLNSAGTWFLFSDGTLWHDNTLTVTGAGSIVSNGSSQPILLGRTGYKNQITISDGGQLIAPSQAAGYSLVVGEGSGGTTASNNTVLVSGTNAVLRAAGHVAVGNTASNTLVITNAGQAVIGGDLLLGTAGSASINNQVAIWGGGTGIVSGAVKIGAASNASNNTVLVTGAGSVLTNTGSLSIGYSGDTLGGGNQLVLGSGGRVFTANLYLRDNALTNTLKFVATPGSTNMGVVNVSGAMTIANANTAKLVVDMSQYIAWRAGVTSVVLATYGSLPTSFSAGNIEVTPPPMLPMRITPTVDQSGGRIQVNLRVPKGTVVSGR